MDTAVGAHVTCDTCGEWYESEPEQCAVCGAEMGEFTYHDEVKE